MGKYEVIDKFFNELKIVDIDNPEAFWENLESKFGQKFCMNASEAMSGRDVTHSDLIYTIKNDTLEKSLEFTTYSKDLYRNYIKAVIDLNLKPKKILDIGSDNGIITCLYGLIYPEAEVIGLEIKSKGIYIGEKIAQKMNLKNVTFIQGDLKKIKNLEEKFDLITSVRSVKEILNLNFDYRLWDFNDVKKIKIKMKEKLPFENLLNKLTENGKCIFFERLSCIDEIIAFNRLLGATNYRLLENDVRAVKFQELGEHQIMPFLVFEQGTDKLDEEKIEEILYDKFIGKEQRKFDEFMKKDIKLIYGVQLNYSNGTGNMREEIYSMNDKYAYVKWSNTGYREVNYIEDFKEKIAELKEEVGWYRNIGKVFEYEEVEKRPIK